MNGSKPKRSPRSTARARWQQHLSAQQTSGQSQADYCRAHGFNPKYFSLWKRKLRLMAGPLPAAEKTQDTMAAAFVPVTVRSTPLPATPDTHPVASGARPPLNLVLKATLRNGLTVELALGSADTLIPVLTQLAALPC